MGSAGNQNPWATYDTYKDCSQGICSIYCPQWCYIVGPPPAFDFAEADDQNQQDSPTDLSPLIIAIIGIFASAFILVTYYTIISRYCRRRGGDGARDMDMDSSNPNLVSESMQGSNNGLDESLIKSITVHKYKKGEKLVEGTDCSVCLSEFEENESLRLLPKCNHAFHVRCIDTWLKSHSSCPLCRSNIAAPAIALVPHQQQAVPPVDGNQQEEVNASASEYQHRTNVSILVVQDNSEEVVGRLESRVSSCEIGQDHHGIQQQLRRSVSIADVLHLHDGEDDDEDLENQMGSAQFSSENLQFSMEIGSSKGVDQEQNSKSSNNPRSSGVFSLVKGPLVLKRSTSTGRLVLSRYGKEKNSIIPN